MTAGQMDDSGLVLGEAIEILAQICDLSAFQCLA